MSYMQTSLSDAVQGVSITDQLEGLSAFLEPNCAATIWRRQPAAEFQNWLDTLDPACLPQGRIALRRDAVRSAVVDLCETCHTPNGRHRNQLVEDIAALADTFADLMRAPYLRLRLQAVTSNACRKFHLDAITARLVCTYRGTGTQYGTAAAGTEPTRVFTVPTGDPVLLRGSLWPQEPASCLLHRSPPIEGTGETRLVLVLDPLHAQDSAE